MAQLVNFRRRCICFNTTSDSCEYVASFYRTARGDLTQSIYLFVMLWSEWPQSRHEPVLRVRGLLPLHPATFLSARFSAPASTLQGVGARVNTVWFVRLVLTRVDWLRSNRPSPSQQKQLFVYAKLLESLLRFIPSQKDGRPELEF